MADDRYSNDYTVEVIGDTQTVTIGRTTNPNDLVVTGNLIVDGTTGGGGGGAVGPLTVNGTLTVTAASHLNGAFINGGLFEVDQIKSPTGDNLFVQTDQDFTVHCDDFVVNATFAPNGVIQMGSSGDIDISTLNGMIELTDGDAGQLTINNSQMEYSGNRSGSAAARIVNRSDDSNADGLTIELGRNVPGSGNVWARFDAGTDNPRGRIRGSSGGGSSAFITTDATHDTADSTAGSPVAVGIAGDVVYASGGADYGEWVEVGDTSEWYDGEIPDNFEDFFKFGLPEGLVVYVRDNKFYKESPGTPMVITERAIVVGNERSREPSFIGEVLSFMGQVPVLVYGPVKSGDYLIANGKNHCVAIDSEKITFAEYKKTIGVAWESSNKSGLVRVNTAIGVKSHVS